MAQAAGVVGLGGERVREGVALGAPAADRDQGDQGGLDETAREDHGGVAGGGGDGGGEGDRDQHHRHVGGGDEAGGGAGGPGEARQERPQEQQGEEEPVVGGGEITDEGRDGEAGAGGEGEGGAGAPGALEGGDGGLEGAEGGGDGDGGAEEGERDPDDEREPQRTPRRPHRLQPLPLDGEPGAGGSFQGPEPAHAGSVSTIQDETVIRPGVGASGSCPRSRSPPPGGSGGGLLGRRLWRRGSSPLRPRRRGRGWCGSRGRVRPCGW